MHSYKYFLIAMRLHTSFIHTYIQCPGGWMVGRIFSPERKAWAQESQPRRPRTGTLIHTLRKHTYVHTYIHNSYLFGLMTTQDDYPLAAISNCKFLKLIQHPIPVRPPGSTGDRPTPGPDSHSVFTLRTYLLTYIHTYIHIYVDHTSTKYISVGTKTIHTYIRTYIHT